MTPKSAGVNLGQASMGQRSFVCEIILICIVLPALVWERSANPEYFVEKISYCM